ncbi:MAG: ABC transporter permease [Candidatus Kerfeldbacteria bacterium]|nr:ABC transporter permease [Candidatus Kerfeldbacteria bacterium]
MRVQFTIFLAGNNLVHKKLRSFLTIGGMSVGVGLIVFLVSLGFGLQRLIRNQVTNVEALTVLDVSKGESTLLELNQKVIKQFTALDGVQDVSASISLSAQLAREDSVTDVALYGIDPKFITLEGVKINHGGSFSAPEAHEVVVTTTALNLIGHGDPEAALGQKLTLKVLVPVQDENGAEDLVTKEIEVTIVGAIVDEELTLAYTPLALLVSLGFEPDYSTAKVKVAGETDRDYSLARIKVEDQSQLPGVRKKIEAMGYQVDSVADTVGQIDKIFLVFEIVMAGFGAIAMFVASIGALNTLTVSLLERTREIGLMKALGARSRDIYRLFLVESITIGLTGGLLGVGIGFVLSWGVNAGVNALARRAGGETVDIFDTPWEFVAAVVMLTFLVGLMTGLYPARRASRINPLDALRYE